MSAIDAARQSLETADKALESYWSNAALKGSEQYQKQRRELTEQWLKLAVIERGLSPYARDTTEEQR